MPIDSNVESRLNLVVGIDKATYGKTKKALEDLFEKQGEIGIDADALKDLANKFRDASRMGGRTAGESIGKALSERFDTEMNDLLMRFEKVQKQVLASFEAGDEAAYEGFLKDQALLAAEIDAETDAHKKRLEAAKKFREATQFNIPNLKKVGGALETGFTDALNKARAGDVSGFAESVGGSIAAAFAKASEVKGLASASAGSDVASAELGKAAAELGMAAAAIAGVAAVVGVAVAAFAMLDDASKELNKSLLEGASIADFSAMAYGSSLRDVEGSLEAARKASFDMADEFRGTSEEMSGILAQLNQAGFTYREIEDGATSAAQKQQKYTEAIKSTYVWSKALGLATSEVADTTAEWSTDFGLGLSQIEESFASIAGFAQEGGFNVKRFFTAVSQATSGMALYNVRMDEAAFLLAKTQKILGGTDASDFVKSLTQGFTDESTTDRIKRIMIAGAADTRDIFENSAARTARSFVEAFSSGQTRADLEAAFKGLDAKFDVSVLNDPQAFQKAWGAMDAKSRRLIIGQLREGTSEQTQAMARQLDTLGHLQDGASKGMAAQVRGLGALDMQGKLAYKLQTLGDKRLNDMSMEELAAFENYAGISGAQLEQLMRVESQLMADYELAKAQGKADGQSFKAWVASNENAQKQIEGVQEITDEATYFARQNVENTRSVFSVLKNTIASILNDIYDLLTTWFGTTKKLSAESQGKMVTALTQISEERKESAARLDSIESLLGDADKVLATSGQGSEAYGKAEADRKTLEAEQKREVALQEYLRAQERQIRLMDETAASSSSDLGAVARQKMSESGEDLKIAGKFLTKEQMAGVLAAQADVGALSMRRTAGDDRAMLTHGSPQKKDVVADMLLSTASTSDGLVKDEIAILKDYTKNFKAEMTDAVADGARKVSAQKLAGDLYGAGTPEYERAVADFMASNFGPHKNYLTAMGQEERVRSDFGVDLSSTIGQDFVMRPGQPAQRFSASDTVVGVKNGGALSSGQGGVVNVNVYGGDQAKVYETVKSALRTSGLRP